MCRSILVHVSISGARGGYARRVLLQVLKAVLMQDAHNEMGLHAAELQDLLEESVDEDALQQTAQSMLDDSREMIWQDERFAVMDTQLDETTWQRCRNVLRFFAGCESVMAHIHCKLLHGKSYHARLSGLFWIVA